MTPGMEYVWTVANAGGITAALADWREPEPDEVLSVEAIWRRTASSLSARDRMTTLRYRQAAMAHHGAWQRRQFERRMERALLKWQAAEGVH